MDMTIPMPRLAGCAALAIGALALSACGSSSKSSSTSTPAAPPPPPSSSGSSSGGAGQDLKLSAVETNGLSFSTKTLTAKAGAVTLTMSNPSGNAQQHGISVEGKGVDKDGKIVAPGGTSTVTVSLKPGTYEFYCPVPGHKQAGMEGKLIVK
jgi:plastocyanin